MSNKFLFWSLVIFNILDVLLTVCVLNLGGIEANPWMNYLITQFGVTGLVIGKIIPLTAFGIILHCYWDGIRPQLQIDLHNVLIMLNLAFFALILYSLNLWISLL